MKQVSKRSSSLSLSWQVTGQRLFILFSFRNHFAQLRSGCIPVGEDRAVENYIRRLERFNEDHVKNGISTYMSYCGAQIFEAVGLSEEIVETYFRGTSSAIGGVGIFELAEEMIKLHDDTFRHRESHAHSALSSGGEYEWRIGGENHMWTPDAIANLQHAVRGNQWESYKQYAQIINDQSERNMTLRGLIFF